MQPTSLDKQTQQLIAVLDQANIPPDELGARLVLKPPTWAESRSFWYDIPGIRWVTRAFRPGLTLAERAVGVGLGVLGVTPPGIVIDTLFYTFEEIGKTHAARQAVLQAEEVYETLKRAVQRQQTQIKNTQTVLPYVLGSLGLVALSIPVINYLSSRAKRRESPPSVGRSHSRHTRRKVKDQLHFLNTSRYIPQHYDYEEEEEDLEQKWLEEEPEMEEKDIEEPEEERQDDVDMSEQSKPIFKEKRRFKRRLKKEGAIPLMAAPLGILGSKWVWGTVGALITAVGVAAATRWYHSQERQELAQQFSQKQQEVADLVRSAGNITEQATQEVQPASTSSLLVGRSDDPNVKPYDRLFGLSLLLGIPAFGGGLVLSKRNRLRNALVAGAIGFTLPWTMNMLAVMASSVTNKLKSE